MRRITHPITGFEAGVRRKALRAAATVAVILGGCAAADGGVVAGSADGATQAVDGQAADGTARRAADAGSASGDTSTAQLANADGHAGEPDAGIVSGDSAGATAEDTGPTLLADAGDEGDAGAGADAASDGDSASGSGDAIVTADAGEVCRLDGDWQTYKHCCELNNWDFKKGCMAWGPPAPLRMRPQTAPRALA